MGGRMPLSSELATAVRLRLQEAHHGEFRGAELQAVRPLLNLQAEWSAIPLPNELLIEQIRTREGFHLLIYPFAGRLVHEGLATLFAWRFAQRQAMTFTMSVNDYGFELLSATEAPLDQALANGLLDEETLVADLEKCLNAAEMGKRQFREIARVAGLVFQGNSGQRSNCRPAVVCSMMCSPIMIRRTFCCGSRAQRCWNASWSIHGWSQLSGFCRMQRSCDGVRSG
jgi:ATP-dependent Lhr-like helicase